VRQAQLRVEPETVQVACVSHFSSEHEESNVQVLPLSLVTYAAGQLQRAVPVVALQVAIGSQAPAHRSRHTLPSFTYPLRQLQVWPPEVF
jgi:hypothetical protein